MKQKLLELTKLRRLLLLAMITLLGSAGAWAEDVTDELTQSWSGVSGTSYSTWSGKTATSDAVYAGNSAGGNSSIQLRSNNNNSGVVTTTSGGKVKSVTVVWDSNTSNGRTLNVYGKNSAYSTASDLYNSSNQGTLLGTIVCGTSTTLEIDDDYEYIGFRSASGAMYLTSVSIVWTTGGGGSTELADCDLALTGAPIALNFDLYNNATAQTIHYTTSSTGVVSVEAGQYDVSCYVDNNAKTITVTPINVTNGPQTVTVNQAADDTYKAGSVTFTVTVTDSTPKTGAWVLTDLADLEEGDVFVIVGNNGSNYAMTNDKGTSSAPAAADVTIANDEITSDISDNIKWNISGNATDGYTFYPNGDTENWLYCTNTNNGVRVGTNDAKTFVIDSNYLKHSGTSRYIGVYNSQDWRCYTNTTGNIANQTFAFYKYEDGTTSKVLSSIALSGEYPTTFHVGDKFSHEGMVVTATYDNASTKDVTASATFSGYDMTTTGTQTITVSYSEGEVTKTATYDITVNAPATLTSITLSGTYPTTFEQGDAFSSEGIVVTANFDDNTTSDVTSEATFSGYDMSAIGEQTVTVTYEGKTATYTINVAEKKGTADNPYTVAETIAAIDAGTGVTGVYATGIVSEIVTAYNSQYGNISYNISADGLTTSNQLQAYRGKSYNGDWFTSEDDIQVGDVVVIYGDLKKYNLTYEFAQDNQLVSLQRIQKANPELSFSPATAEATFGEEFTAPTLNTAEGFNGTVEYSSSDETVAQVMDIETGELRIVGSGTTTITANFAGNDDFKAGSASYTLTVTDNRIATTITQENITIDIADVATLTQLTPVVKDANNNVVSYTNSPTAEGLPEVYFETVSDDNGILGSFDSHGNIVLNSVLGTATIKAVFNQFQLKSGYRPSECTFTITVFDPSTYVALVAKYNGKHYAMNADGSSTWGATEVDAVNGKVITERTDAISWIISPATANSTTKVIFKNVSSQKYLNYKTSGTELAAGDTSTDWVIDSENNTWTNQNGGTSGTVRTLLYNGTGFRNYAASNVNGSGYSDYTHAYTFSNGYTREVTADKYGTICLPYAVAANDFSGVTFYQIVGKKGSGAELQYVKIEEVTNLEGGVAYLFKANAEATKLIAAYSGEVVSEPVSLTSTGLVGTYTKQYIPQGKYILKDGTIYFVDQENYVYSGANKAYIDLDNVPEINEIKGICLYGEGFDTDGVKAIDNAQMTNDSVVYDLAGRRVARPIRGIYIVNGKKVLVK